MPMLSLSFIIASSPRFSLLLAVLKMFRCCLLRFSSRYAIRLPPSLYYVDAIISRCWPCFAMSLFRLSPA